MSTSVALIFGKIDAELLGDNLRGSGQRAAASSTAPLTSVTVPSGLSLT